MLVACDSTGTDIKNKAVDLLQDVDSKLKQSELPVSPQVATVISLEARTCIQPTYCLYVVLKPTNNAIANKTYIVSLYEKGSLRDGAVVQWNQPELNVLKEKAVTFPISAQEWDAYFMEDISHIFTVKVHE
jgi:hypothetical protein